ncbi:MAG: peptide deformylase [Thermomicrobiales bacterium]
MAMRDIIFEGDPRLRRRATKIRAVDDEVRRLAQDMFETMVAAPGVGLAAPQVGVTRRLIVAHVPASYIDEGDAEFSVRLANPEIVRAQGREVDTEGCLSIPGWVGDVPRAEVITVRAVDMDNKPVRIKARGFFARVLQHEIDHLDGILYIDRVEDRETMRPAGEGDGDEADGMVASTEMDLALDPAAV